MRGSYELRVDPSAHRQLQQIPERFACAIAEFMVGPLLANPQRVGGALHGVLHDYRSARVGAYRLLYRIAEEEQQVRIVRIGHRADVYRR